MELRIEKTDAYDFLNCWRETLGQLSDKHINSHHYDTKRAALVFSFDSKMKPFLGFTIGYNHRVEKRKYFHRIPSLMLKVGRIMLSYRDMGGRVFIDNERAYYVNHLLESWNLCDLTWPEDMYVVSEITNYWLSTRALMTIRVPENWKRRENSIDINSD